MPIATEILTPEEIKQKLREIPGWKYQDNKLTKEFDFEDFAEAFALVEKLLPFVERLDHHPDIHWLYNTITFELQRFDAGNKVTNKDFLVASEIERLHTEQNAAKDTP